MQQLIKTPLGVVSQANELALVPIIDPKKFSFVTHQLRTFFLRKGFVEVHTQNRLSILAACENPHSIATYDYCGNVWPLPQTGQMWLEHELLTKPDVPGYFCVSTSYRNEKDPIRGRHHRIFPMFEFELHGDINELIKLEIELLEFLGFGNAIDFIHKNYEEMSEEFSAKILEAEHELEIYDKYGPVFFLENFPERTHPFWNMKRKDGLAQKVDVLLHGVETIGSAERSCDAEEQRNSFYTIEEGKYAEKLFDLFGKERVVDELEDFLSHEFFQRSGGGLGIPRMIRAFELSKLI